MTPAIRRMLAVGRALFGAGLLVYVVLASGALGTAQRVLAVPWMLPLIALVFPLTGVAVESLRLRALFAASGYTLTFSRAYQLVTISALFGYAVPGGTGADVVKLYYLATEHRGQTIEMAAILLVDRLAALFALMLVVLALGMAEGHLLFETAIGRSLALLSLAVLGTQGLLTAVAWSHWVRATRLYRWLTTDAPAGRLIGRLAAALHRFGERRGAVARAVAWSVVGHLLVAALFGLAAHVTFGAGSV
ncbi:MAG: flippase-like domain-containing protein, partial [Gemmatimonadota bacterium]|nr:flippase-like domain-containing protein [Gemmatimonadota bacterium]